MTFEMCVKQIMDIPKFAPESSLQNTKKILAELVKDSAKIKIIHVAGTNGKGSVCSYISSILKESGYKVGVFTSPHLIDIRERIVFDGQFISKDDFVLCYERVLSCIESMKLPIPTFFEILFLMAMSYYCAKQPDYLVLETGLGGRLDATNAVEDKVLTVITEIGLDHMAYLGNTFSEIAREKAGIIRRNVPLVFCDKRNESTNVIINEFNIINENTENNQEICQILKKNYITNVERNDSENIIKYDFECQQIHMKGIELNTAAYYQCENSALAILGVKALGDCQITEDSIRRGILKCFWPGRMEQIEKGVYVDGAHNEDGIEAMLDTVKHLEGKKNLLFAVVNDKNYIKMIKMISESHLFENIVIASVGDNRKTDAEEIASYFKGTERITVIDDAKEAFKKCIEERMGNTLIVMGSLYLVGAIKELYSD